MLIRDGSERIYFFSKLCLNLGADLFLNLGNIRPRRLTSYFRTYSFFKHAVLRVFVHYELKLAVGDLIVGQCFGNEPINRVAFRDGKRNNLMMFLYLGVKLFAGDDQP